MCSTNQTAMRSGSVLRTFVKLRRVCARSGTETPRGPRRPSQHPPLELRSAVPAFQREVTRGAEPRGRRGCASLRRMGADTRPPRARGPGPQLPPVRFTNEFHVRPAGLSTTQLIFTGSENVLTSLWNLSFLKKHLWKKNTLGSFSKVCNRSCRNRSNNLICESSLPSYWEIIYRFR